MDTKDEKELDAILVSEELQEPNNLRSSERQKAGFKIVFLKRMGTYYVRHEINKDIADVIDISKGGICFTSDENFDREEQVLFASVGLKKNFTAEIRICHKFPMNEKNGYGCQFVKINDIQKVKV